MPFFRSISACLRAVLICTILLFAVSGISSGAPAKLEVLVEGLEEVARLNVELALTPPEGILNNDQVNEPLLALFLKEIPPKVREALEPFGYYHAKVETFTERPTDRLLLHIKVDPGNPVRVAFIKIELQGPGAEDEKLKEALQQFPLKDNDILRQDFYEEGKKVLQDAARELGYLAADFSTHVIQLSLADNLANLHLILETGPRYYFGEVTFVPPLTYPESFLRRYLAFRSGRPFSPQRLARTQLNFNNADRFSEVTIEADRDEALDFQVPVRIRLTPSKPKRFRFGAGYETDNGLGMLVRFHDLNFNHLNSMMYSNES